MKAFGRWILILSLFGLVFLVVAKQQDIKDWYVLRTYDPPAAIENLAIDTGMSDRGQHLFYVARPQLDSRQDFNLNCPFPERTLVLGCYSNQRIYIFEVDEDRLEGVEEVTAAHEMLHVAYVRLSPGERDRIDQLIEDTYKKINNSRLDKSVSQYEETDPGSVPNELHSILGTEHRNLPDELEEYYSQYFEDRLKVVAIAEDYEDVFISLQDQIAAYDRQVSSLKSQIDSLEAKLESASRNLDSESARLDALLAANNVSVYNATVPGYNLAVNNYNALFSQYQTKVDKHNEIVDVRNNIATQQNTLIQSLDSKFEQISN